MQAVASRTPTQGSYIFYLYANSALTRLHGRSFGYGFNNAEGGVFALLWDNAVGMSMWHFARADIPSDLTAQKPNPSTWSTPAGFWSAQSCNISANFYDQQMVIDTTLCGNWAGGSAYSKSGCSGTCTDMIANATNYVGKFSNEIFILFLGGSVIWCRCEVGHQLRCRLPVNPLSTTRCLHTRYTWTGIIVIFLPLMVSFINQSPWYFFLPCLLCIRGIGDLASGLLRTDLS